LRAAHLRSVSRQAADLPAIHHAAPAASLSPFRSHLAQQASSLADEARIRQWFARRICRLADRGRSFAGSWKRRRAGPGRTFKRAPLERGIDSARVPGMWLFKWRLIVIRNKSEKIKKENRESPAPCIRDMQGLYSRHAELGVTDQ
jgi:hypothetical protein